MGLIRGALGMVNIQGWVGVIVGVVLAALLGLQVHRTHLTETKLTNTQASLVAVQGTVINYQRAAAQAQADAYANKAHVEAQYKAVSERTKADYEARIAGARATADRLRDQLKGSTHPGSTDPARLPGGNPSGPGAAPASEDHGLSIDERLIATEQAIQLDALIDYVNGVLNVRPGGSPSGAKAEDRAGRQ